MPTGSKSKAVLVTGCSSGIGAATAEHLVNKGWTVYATARKVETLAALEAKGCKTLALDVLNEASMVSAVAAVEEAEGAVGVLVNNAGYSQSGAIEDVGIDQVRKQFETNVFGLVRMTQLVLPGMRRQGWGKVVNVSSMGANFTFPGGGYYHSTKYAVEAISDALRFEVRDFGIDTIIIQPGIIRTNFDQAAVTALSEGSVGEGPYSKFNAMVAKSTQEVYEEGPLAKLGGGPETVAKAIEKAITARRPKARYRVTPSAKLLTGIGKRIPARMWDTMMRSQFPSPAKSGE